MSDLNQVVDLGVLSNHRVPIGPAVDTGICTDGDTILEDHPTKLRHIDHPAGPDSGPESGFADNGAGIDARTVPDQGEAYDCISAHITASAKGHARTDHGAGG